MHSCVRRHVSIWSTTTLSSVRVAQFDTAYRSAIPLGVSPRLHMERTYGHFSKSCCTRCNHSFGAICNSCRAVTCQGRTSQEDHGCARHRDCTLATSASDRESNVAAEGEREEL